MRRRVALLGHPSYHYEALTARENLRVAARFLGRTTDASRPGARWREVGLAERADDAVAEFSAGMRKRLALARVLLQDAEVVPPGRALRRAGSARLPPARRLFGELRAAARTVILATPPPRTRACDLCDQALVLEEGRLAWSGPAAEPPGRGGGPPGAGPVSALAAPPQGAAAAVADARQVGGRLRLRRVALLLFSFAVGPTPLPCASTPPGSSGWPCCCPRRWPWPRASRPRPSTARSRACCSSPPRPAPSTTERPSSTRCPPRPAGGGARAGDGGTVRRRHARPSRPRSGSSSSAPPAFRRPGRFTLR